MRLKTAFEVEGDRNVPAPLIGTPVQRHIRLHSPFVNQIFEMRPQETLKAIIDGLWLNDDDN